MSSLSDGLERWRVVVSPCWGVIPDGIFEVEQRLEGQRSARLSSRPLVDGWLVGLTLSQRVPLCGKADSKGNGPGGM